MKSVCQLVEEELMALLSFELGKASEPISSLSSSLGIPLIMVDSSGWWGRLAPRTSSAINLAPEPAIVGKALSDVIKAKAMVGAAMIYYNENDFILLQSLVEKIGFFHSGTKLVLVQNTTLLTEELSMLSRQGFTSFVLLSCAPEQGLEFLESSLLAGILNPGRKVLLPCLGLQPENLDKFRYVGAEISLFYLAGSANTDYQTMLIQDSLTALSGGLLSLKLEGWQSLPVRLSCSESGYWQDGARLTDRIRNNQFLGKSGSVKIDSRGIRSEFSISLLEITRTGFNTGGVWTPRDGYLVSGTAEKVEEEEEEGRGRKRMLTMATVLSDPYTMLKADAKTAKRAGNDRYEGFAVDLINKISEIVDFNFSISVVSGYGSRRSDGSWTGMIQEILEGRADMAVADLSINSEREEVVDFSMPFLDLGISILFVASPSKSIDLFSFLAPLSTGVWVLMIGGGCLVSICIYFISRFSPFETAEIDSSEGESPFTSLHHCLWFSIASWVQQGCDFLPRAISTRTIATAWWFFTLIMISSYTANLAAFLTIERMDLPISSIEDLANSKIRYGSIHTGSTASFFRDSHSAFYKKMWKNMAAFDNAMVESNSEGMAKVLEEDGGYAFFMESVTIEYQVERNCKLTQIGGLLDSKSYGVALPQGSQLRSLVSSAIIRLREEGEIARLKQKWWQEERGGGACESDEKAAGGVSELTLENVGGIFLVLLLGLVIGGLVAVVEVYWLHCNKTGFLI